MPLLKISLQNTHGAGFFFELITPESISSRDTRGYYARVEKRGEVRRNFISWDIMHGAEVMLDEVW